MNAIRRKRLAKIIESIEEIKADLEEVFEEEESCRDNMPESLWETDRYQAMDEACDSIQSAIDALDEATENIEEIEGVA